MANADNGDYGLLEEREQARAPYNFCSQPPVKCHKTY